jgi:hypothetical protein
MEQWLQYKFILKKSKPESTPLQYVKHDSMIIHSDMDESVRKPITMAETS